METIKVKCTICNEEQILTPKAIYVAKRRSEQKKEKTFKYRCRKCFYKENRGTNSWSWKNGRSESLGYIFLSCKSLPDYETLVLPMCKDKYIREHRYVMAKHLNRPLESTEHIHHINGNKLDNRIDNLELINGATHSAVTHMESIWERKISDLQEENAKLKEQLFELVE